MLSASATCRKVGDLSILSFDNGMCGAAGNNQFLNLR